MLFIYGKLGTGKTSDRDHFVDVRQLRDSETVKRAASPRERRSLIAHSMTCHHSCFLRLTYLIFYLIVVGILADEMGLGKTIQVIALMIATSTPKAPSSSPSCSSPVVAEASQECISKPTLIVCPLSVINNWTHQIDTHVEAHRFSVYVYHGSSHTSCMLLTYPISMIHSSTTSQDLPAGETQPK